VAQPGPQELRIAPQLWVAEDPLSAAQDALRDRCPRGTDSGHDSRL